MKFWITFTFLIPLIALNSATNIQCDFEYDNWSFVGPMYQCKVQNNLNISSPYVALVESAAGSHESTKTIDDVNGIYARNKKIKYFPQGLNIVFKNLQWICINYGRIKEIHQADLQHFPKLKYLNLFDNDIEILEQGLFDHNPLLGLIGLSYNKITQIHVQVFDHLNMLSFLHLSGNNCIDMQAESSLEAVKEVIKEAKGSCPSPVPITKKEIDAFKDELKLIVDEIVDVTKEVTEINDKMIKVSEELDNLAAILRTVVHKVNENSKTIDDVKGNGMRHE